MSYAWLLWIAPNLKANEHLQREQNAGSVSEHPLDPLSTRRPRLKRVAEVLGFAGHLPVSELHDADRVRRPSVIGQGKFSDPEIARADYPPHREAFPVRLRGARRLNVAPAADPLARLRILEHRILSVNLVLRLEVIGVGGSPVAIQGRSDVVSLHLVLPLNARCPHGHPQRRVTAALVCPALSESAPTQGDRCESRAA